MYDSMHFLCASRDSSHGPFDLVKSKDFMGE